MDQQYLDRFAVRVHELFPGCPPGRETVIAEHACLKYSGRVGRTAAAKSLDAAAVRLSVIAHIRHAETHFDELLVNSNEKREARDLVKAAVDRVLARLEVQGRLFGKGCIATHWIK